MKTNKKNKNKIKTNIFVNLDPFEVDFGGLKKL